MHGSRVVIVTFEVWLHCSITLRGIYAFLFVGGNQTWLIYWHRTEKENDDQKLTPGRPSLTILKTENRHRTETWVLIESGLDWKVYTQTLGIHREFFLNAGEGVEAKEIFKPHGMKTLSKVLTLAYLLLFYCIPTQYRFT